MSDTYVKMAIDWQFIQRSCMQRGAMRCLAMSLLYFVLPIPSQAQTLSRPMHFETVSIRPHARNDSHHDFEVKPDGFFAHGNSLTAYLVYAYHVSGSRVESEAQWVDRAVYDLEAKVAPEDVGSYSKMSKDEQRLVLKEVLEDRFGVKVHAETRIMPVYELVISKTGPKLKVLSEASFKAPACMERRAAHGRTRL